MQILRFETLGSTNDQAKRLLHKGDAGEGTVILVREQTTGRGTNGRTWLSPPDAGIYLSYVHVPAHPARTTSLYTKAAGVACILALRSVTGLTVELKPINDLMVSGRKLGGILTEADFRGPNLASVIVGIGINTHRANRTLPSGTPRPVSLQDLMPEEEFSALVFDEVMEWLVIHLSEWLSMVDHGPCDQKENSWNGFVANELAVP